MIAYHFLKADFTAGFGDEPPWKVGETRTVAEPSRIKLCEYGYHTSPTLRGALQYAQGPIACLDDISEPLDRDESRQVSATRTLVAAVNVERELRLFAADCAEHVLPIFERAYAGDRSPREAIAAARAFAEGKIGPTKLAAARAGAEEAALGADGDGGWAAAYAANAARGATHTIGCATSAAAWYAAWAAGEDGADPSWAAGEDGADPSWGAAHAAEEKWQRARFEERLGGIFEAAR
ncbi:MAG: putative immunity protein [Candidatus Binataceae bacterium]